MFNQTKRGLTEGIIKMTVKDNRTLYTITASPKKENGKYDLVIYKNGKVFSETKNVATSVKGMNRKIKTTADFYNLSNNVKRLASLEQKTKETEKTHKLNIRKRENSIKREIERRKKQVIKIEKTVVKTDKDLDAIMTSYISLK